MRYYDLDNKGRVISHSRWPFRGWIELPEAPGEFYLWDGSQWVEDTETIKTERRASLHQYLAQLGRRRRLALVGRSPNDQDVDSAEMMLQIEQAMLQNKRETGRTNANENARLDDELEPLAVSMLSEWQAQQAIKPKIDNDAYTTEADIDSAREWP